MKHVLKYFVIVLFLGAFVGMAGCSVPVEEATVEAPVETEVEQPEILETVLELVKGDEVIYFTMDQLKALPAVEGLGGIMSSTGKITAPVMHKGVLVSTLLEEIGGITEENSVEIVAEDGYSITYSPNQILEGDYITYDVSSGDEIDKIGTLQTIIAYERDGQPLNSDSDGNLRLVMVGESPLQVVDGHWSIKYVNKIVVKDAVDDWVVDFIGAIDEPMDRATFESGATDDCHGRSWTDADGHEWKGIPLFYLVGRVDDEIKHGDDSFLDDLAKAGAYNVIITSADGYQVALDSLRVMRNDNIIVAYLMDGQPLEGEDFPLRMVGDDLSKKEMVGGIVSVVLEFVEAEATEEPTEEPAVEQPIGETPAVIGPAEASVTITGLVDAEVTLTMEELLNMAVVNLSVEHPKSGMIDVTGVRMTDVLALVDISDDATTVFLIASDGYSSDVPLADLLACENCLVGWDEEMIRSTMPGFGSSAWVKDLTFIEFK